MTHAQARRLQTRFYYINKCSVRLDCTKIDVCGGLHKLGGVQKQMNMHMKIYISMNCKLFYTCMHLCVHNLYTVKVANYITSERKVILKVIIMI